MRNHLISVRRYHRIVLYIVILALVVFIGIDIYKFLGNVQTLIDGLKFGGCIGMTGAILWYCQRAMWANRISQLSLALFESLVAEVSASLSEIPKSLSTEERRRIRAEIWNAFRDGVNHIWLEEKELLDTWEDDEDKEDEEDSSDSQDI